jgi:hypothetical protein
MRRFTRLTNAFSKKVENHAHAMSIYFMHYNFVRIHQTLRVTPAMEAGVQDMFGASRKSSGSWKGGREANRSSLLVAAPGSGRLALAVECRRVGSPNIPVVLMLAALSWSGYVVWAPKSN